MDIRQIPKERVDEFKEFVKEVVEKRPSITPSEIALKSFYRGFTEFRFTDARSVAEQTRKIHIQQIGI